MQRRIFVIVPSIVVMLVAWPVQACDLAGKCEGSAGEAARDFSSGSGGSFCSASGVMYLTEMREEDDTVVYESIPENVGFPNIQEEEREKQEKAWEMLNNSLIVAPDEGRRGPRPIPERGR